MGDLCIKNGYFDDATKWFRKAAEQGNTYAIEALQKIIEYGTN